MGLNALQGLIGAEFLLGMALTLYAPSLPSDLAPALGVGAGTPSVGMTLLAAHFLLGIATGLAALVDLLFALRTRVPRLLGGSLFALGGVALASVAGLSFVRSGGVPGYSFAMAVGFLVAFWSAFWTRMQLREAERASV